MNLNHIPQDWGFTGFTQFAKILVVTSPCRRRVRRAPGVVPPVRAAPVVLLPSWLATPPQCAVMASKALDSQTPGVGKRSPRRGRKGTLRHVEVEYRGKPPCFVGVKGVTFRHSTSHFVGFSWSSPPVSGGKESEHVGDMHGLFPSTSRSSQQSV